MVAAIYPSSKGCSLWSKEAVNSLRLSKKLGVPFVHLPASDNWLPKT